MYAFPQPSKKTDFNGFDMSKLSYARQIQDHRQSPQRQSQAQLGHHNDGQQHQPSAAAPGSVAGASPSSSVASRLQNQDTRSARQDDDDDRRLAGDTKTANAMQTIEER
jgi:hypothetical protein